MSHGRGWRTERARRVGREGALQAGPAQEYKQPARRGGEHQQAFAGQHLHRANDVALGAWDSGFAACIRSARMASPGMRLLCGAALGHLLMAGAQGRSVAAI